MTATPAQILAATKEQKLAEDRIRREKPLCRLWDAEWQVQFVLGDEYQAKFNWISNDTGPGQIEIPFTSKAAQWIWDYQSRLDNGEGRTIGLTVDYTGARWSGMLDKFAVEQREDGDMVLVCDFLHDFEKLKWYTVVSNPFTSDAFQFPRAFLLAGPITWTLRMTLFLAIWREHNPFLTWPDDPMDLDNWLSMGLDQSNWHIVVKPESFLDAMASGVVWSVASSRWTNFYDMAYYMCEDAEISIQVRRYLPGDDLPWAGANLRYGTVVVDFVDKSGIMVGTSHGGSVFSGLVRTAIEFADDFIDSTNDLIADADTPGDYFLVGSRYTDPVKPYVIFYEGDTSPIQTSSWVYSPSKGVQISVGGKSAPGVNETISACCAADTLIDGPDGKERIDVLAERGEPFRVWSITPEGQRVAATASTAFRKGYAELFTYQLADGRSITVTKDHRFLTPSGFVKASAIEAGDPVCIVDLSVPAADEPVRQVHDDDYILIDSPWQSVEAITPIGWDYFYDMTVPGWENYAAQGIWNHNSIQAVGDIVGGLIQIGSLGGTIDTLLAPLYTDTILAWQSFKSNERANNTGWDRYFSYFQDSGGGSKAYTIQALLVLRAGMWATKTQVSWKVQVADGQPYMVGDNKVGHFFLDDRVGLVIKGDDKIHMDRCRKLELAWTPDTPPEWTINIGDERIFQDPAQRALGRIERLIAGLHDIGVWSALAVIGGLMMLGAFFSVGDPASDVTTTASAAISTVEALALGGGGSRGSP